MRRFCITAMLTALLMTLVGCELPLLANRIPSNQPDPLRRQPGMLANDFRIVYPEDMELDRQIVSRFILPPVNPQPESASAALAFVRALVTGDGKQAEAMATPNLADRLRTGQVLEPTPSADLSRMGVVACYDLPGSISRQIVDIKTDLDWPGYPRTRYSLSTSVVLIFADGNGKQVRSDSGQHILRLTMEKKQDKWVVADLHGSQVVSNRAEPTPGLPIYAAFEDGGMESWYVQQSGAEARLFARVHQYPPFVYALSPDILRLAYIEPEDGSGRSSLNIQTIEGQVLVSLSGSYISLAWSNDGKRLAVVEEGTMPEQSDESPYQQVKIVDLKGKVTTLKTNVYISRVLGFSSDSKELYVIHPYWVNGFQIERLAKLTIRTGQVMDLIGDPSDGPMHGDFRLITTPAGEEKVVYTASRHTDTRFAPISICIANRDGSGEKVFAETEDGYFNLVWGTDGSVAYHNTHGIWYVRPDGSPPELLLADRYALTGTNWQLEGISAAGRVWVRDRISGSRQQVASDGLPFVPGWGE